MSGLVVSLKANEKFLVNGALLINGPKRSQIRVGDEDINILRLSDAIHPSDVNTPIKRVYYAAQLYLSGDASATHISQEVKDGLSALATVFDDTPLLPAIEKAQKAAHSSRYYSVLCTLKPLMPVEAEMLKSRDNHAQAIVPDVATLRAVG